MDGITRDRNRSEHLRTRLLGPDRHRTLTLDEVIEAGRILFGDPDGLSYYGLPPADWYARGIRILGRTCVEATPDVTAGPLARTAQSVLGTHPGTGVVDLFAGSGNMLLHTARALSATACGMEADEAVWRRTDANLRLVAASATPAATPAATPVTVRPGDWQSYFADPLPVDTAVYLISPPWGPAFSFATGLDLSRTTPPVPRIVDVIAAQDSSPHCYALIQHTPVEPVLNAAAVTGRYPLVGSGRGCFIVRVR